MQIAIPQLCLVVLVGVSGSGKSTFAREHFGRFEVVSSDFCRGLVADDENDQSASAEAFDLLNVIVGKRLAAGRLTVIDATSVTKEARAELVALARAHDVLPVAIVLDTPVTTALERNRNRADRAFGEHVVHRQAAQLRKGLRGLRREGFRTVHVLTPDDLSGLEVVREPLLNDYRHLHGPFDIVGDVHGCLAELLTLLDRLGYTVTRDERNQPIDAVHPERTLIFVGDLVDRGPDVVGVLRLAMGMTAAGHALAVPGNHENKLVRALDGKKVQRTHGLAETLDQLAAEPPELSRAVRDWCYGLVSHLVLDDGHLVVAHAGLPEAYHGRASGRVRSFALYGDTTGETDEFGLPVRYPWARDYRGHALVAYGHTPTPELVWVNNTICLDTGAVFGGHLSALRYPERELVQVPAERVWCEPVRPLVPVEPVRDAAELRLEDVTGVRGVQTEVMGRITVRAENAAGALEVMSRFALPPGWLPYLPPTMAPVPTSARADVLEHPHEAFTTFAADGVVEVVCEEKHMGSRAVLVVCRDESTAARRFAADGRTGAIYTRTGRSFFERDLTEALLAEVRAAVTTTGLWDELGTDWLVLDAELLPWSAKADTLLREQYATVGAAARGTLPAQVDALTQAAARGLDVADLLDRTRLRMADADAYTAAYRRYCWDVDGLDGIEIAPFQLLASEGRTWHDHDHGWHLALADRLVSAAPTRFRSTRRHLVDTGDADSCAAGLTWWEELTGGGGEGMVVKPLANLVRLPKGLVQPGLKVRGREYLRIIYGPDYTLPANLDRLRQRSLGRKRSLAQREYALGLESLQRLANGEPLWRVHEAVFAVLALESEPVDPRL